MHIKSSETVNKHDNVCKVCGKVAYSKYSIFGVYLCLVEIRGKPAERTCFFDYHNGHFFGLARED